MNVHSLNGRASRPRGPVALWRLVGWIGITTIWVSAQPISPYVIPPTGPIIYDNSDLGKYHFWAFFSTNEYGNEISFAPARAPGFRSIGRAFDDYWVKTTNRWVTRQLADLMWATNLLPHEFPSYGIRMEAASALTNLKISSIPGTFDFGTPPIVPPGYLDLITSQIDGFDTNRLNTFTTLLLGSQFPGYGRVEIQPYVSAQYPEGTTITLNAVAAPGCFFQAWSGAVDGTNNSVSLSLTSNATLNVAFGALAGRVSSIRGNGNKVTLEWPGTFLLEQSSSLNGPWVDAFDVDGEWFEYSRAKSPFTTHILSTLQFYRLKNGFEY